MNFHFPFAVESLAGRIDWVERAGWMLVHSLWQFALVALFLGAALRWMTRATPKSRYAACLVALAMWIVLPVVTCLTFREQAARDPLPRELVVHSSDPSERKGPERSDPVVDRRRTIVESIAASQSPLAGGAEIAPATAPVSIDRLDWRPRVDAWLPLIVWSWLAGVALFAARPVLSCWTVRRLRVTGTAPVSAEIGRIFATAVAKLGLRRRIGIVQSGLVKVPAVIGSLRPVVLLPFSVASGFPPDQVEALIAHELAHIRRHDDLVNLLQTAVETLFFYHPATWWVSRQIRCEREDCCDDVVLSVCRSQTEYAKALVALEQLRAGVPATALAAAGGSLLSRIRRIAGADIEPRPGLGGILCAAALVVAFAIAGLTPRLARTADRPAPPERPPAVQPAPASPAAVRPTEPALNKSVEGRGESFRVVLADGALIELLGIGENPPHDKGWWSPDGVALAKAIDWPVREIFRPNPIGKGLLIHSYLQQSFRPDPVPNSVVRLFALDVVGPASPEVLVARSREDDAMPAHPSDAPARKFVGENVLEQHRFPMQLRANSNVTRSASLEDGPLRPFEFQNGADISRTTLVVTYAAPWRSIGSTTGGLNATARLNEGVAFDEPTEEEGAARIAATYDLGDVDNDNVRIIATDKEGRMYRTENQSSVSALKARLLVAQFPGLPRKRVKEFSLQTRRVQRIEFRNISLERGKKTKVEIFLDGKRYESKAVSVKDPAGRAGAVAKENSAAAAPTARASTLDRIFANWRLEQARIKSFYIAFSIGLESRRLRFDDSRAHPLVQWTGPGHKLWVAGNEHFRAESSVVLFSGKTICGGRRQIACDGKTYREVSIPLIPIGTDGEPIDRTIPFGPSGRIRRLKPSVEHEQILPDLVPMLAFRPLQVGFGRWGAENSRVVTEDAAIDGGHYAQIEKRDPKSRIVETCWVDPIRNDLVVRFDRKYPDGSEDWTAIEYKPDPIYGYVPAGWHGESTDDIGARERKSRGEAVVNELKINEDFPPNTFEFNFPPGAIVIKEEDTKLDTFLRRDASKRFFDRFLHGDTLKYEQPVIADATKPSVP